LGLGVSRREDIFPDSRPATPKTSVEGGLGHH
jgi:hypothetical protein